MAEGQTTAWLHEAGVAGRDGDDEARRDQRPTAGRFDDRILSGIEVGTGIAFSGITG